MEAIIGMNTWQEVALVAGIGNKSQIPVLSFAAPATTTSPLNQLRWPFLIQLTNHGSLQMKCIADVIRTYGWRKVIAIYEDSDYGGNFGTSELLSEALQSVGSEVEYQLVLPPFSSLSDPKGVVQEELLKLLSKQSRVFIVLQSSLDMATHLFREAKKMGFVGRESAWIITDTIASFLDSVNTSIISSMEGTLGIKTYYSDTSTSYQEFRTQFRQVYRAEYPEEDYGEPGIHALRAYDSIQTIAQALGRRDSDTSTKVFLESILSSNFDGLSGKISFKEGQLEYNPVLKIVNVVGKRYKELDFWTPELGFSQSLDTANGKEGSGSKVMLGMVNWPGDLYRPPKGWVIPTSDSKRMKIGVPTRPAFENFVKIEYNEDLNSTQYSGLCIEVFNKVIEILGYDLPYEFIPHHDSSYDDLVNCVINKVQIFF